MYQKYFYRLLYYKYSTIIKLKTASGIPRQSFDTAVAHIQGLTSNRGSRVHNEDKAFFRSLQSANKARNVHLEAFLDVLFRGTDCCYIKSYYCGSALVYIL